MLRISDVISDRFNAHRIYAEVRGSKYFRNVSKCYCYNIDISIQRDETMRSIYSLFHCNLLIYSTCFGWHLHPSSGIQETVVVDHWCKLRLT
jgi:hypothetical protein